MPNNAIEKTKSAPRSWRLPASALLGAVFLLILTTLVVYSHPVYQTLRAGGHAYRLEVVATPSAQAKGLGGRTSMPTNQGMLFSFSNAATRCFWMKDMHFSLDMIWVQTDGRIGAIETDISPGTYPHAFCPTVSAKYVIELDANQAQIAGMHIGQILRL